MSEDGNSGVCSTTNPGRETNRRDDEVDRIVAGWHQVRPDLDVTPLQVFSRISRISRMLDLARRRAFAKHSIESWEFDVLSALRRSGEPHGLTPGRLIAETLVSSGTMTNRIDRMVAHGLVSRLPDPQDGRVVHVALTPLGTQKVDAAITDLLIDEAALLDTVGAHRAADLGADLRALLLPLEDGSPA